MAGEMTMARAFGATCAAALLVLGAAGCNAKGKAVTADEQANWKGGPMPPEFQKELAAKQRQAAEEAKKSAAAAPSPGEAKP
jgi:hypothetical protein